MNRRSAASGPLTGRSSGGSAGRSAARLPLGLPGALLRASSARALLFAVLVAAAALALATVPAWFSVRTADALAIEVRDMGPGRLGLEFGQGGHLEPLEPSDPMSGVTKAGDAIASSLPASVAAVTGGYTTTIDTQEYGAIDAPVPITRVVMRFMPDAGAMTRFVDGVAPTGNRTEHQIGQLHDQDGAPMMGSSFEAAVSREAADELHLHVGDHLSLVPGASINGVALGITITGIFEAVDPTDPRWFNDVTLLSPVEVRASSEVTIYHLVALLSDDAYPAFAGLDSFLPPLRYRWRFPVAASGANRWDVGGLSSDLARLQVAYPFNGALPADVPGMSTGLADVLARYEAERAVAGSAFALAGAGPLAAGAGLLAVTAMSVAERRRTTVRVLRARGGRGRRLLAAEALAAGVVTVPAAAVGVAIAATLAGALGASTGAVALGATAALTAVIGFTLLIVAAAPSLLGPAAVRQGRERHRLLTPARARVLKALLVIVAVAAAVGLRSSAASPGDTGTISPALVPVLLALAGGIVLTQAFGFLVQGLARLAARSRGFALVHTFRGLARATGTRDLPFVVLAVAVAAGVFASVVAGSLARSQDVAAANQVGADYRVSAATQAGLPVNLDVARLAAIGPVAEVGVAGGSLSSRTLASAFVSSAVVDPASYARVVDGTLVDARIARALALDMQASGAGPAVPLTLRASFAARIGLQPGAEVTFTVAGKPMPAVVVEVLADLPGLPSGTDAAVATTALDATAAASATPIAVLLRAGPDPAPIDAVIAPYRSQLDVLSRSALLQALSDTPMATAMRAGFALMLALASVLAGVVVAASLVAALGTRAREAAVLRSLGSAGGSARRLVAGEAALTVLVALATGLLLGLAVAWLTIPDLGLERIAGVSADVVPVADAGGVLVAIAGPLLVGLVALALSLVAVRGGAASARLLAEEG